MNKKKIAIIGASANRGKFGNKAVRAYKDDGWDVYPVNTAESTIEDLTVYRDILEVPGELDRISVYVPPAIGLQLIEKIAEKNSGEVWFNPGSDSDELLDRAKELGVNSMIGCSIVDIGRHPSEYD